MQSVEPSSFRGAHFSRTCSLLAQRLRAALIPFEGHTASHHRARPDLLCLSTLSVTTEPMKYSKCCFPYSVTACHDVDSSASMPLLRTACRDFNSSKSMAPWCDSVLPLGVHGAMAYCLTCVVYSHECLPRVFLPLLLSFVFASQCGVLSSAL